MIKSFFFNRLKLLPLMWHSCIYAFVFVGIHWVTPRLTFNLEVFWNSGQGVEMVSFTIAIAFCFGSFVCVCVCVLASVPFFRSPCAAFCESVRRKTTHKKKPSGIFFVIFVGSFRGVGFPLLLFDYRNDIPFVFTLKFNQWVVWVVCFLFAVAVALGLQRPRRTSVEAVGRRRRLLRRWRKGKNPVQPAQTQ